MKLTKNAAKIFDELEIYPYNCNMWYNFSRQTGNWSVGILKTATFAEKHNINIIIIKFSATWCRPCQKIKTLCYKYFMQMPESVVCFDIDIDNNIELYAALKAKKKIRGVPTLLAFNCNKQRDINHWYIPDLSVSGSDEKNLLIFFKKIY